MSEDQGIESEIMAALDEEKKNGITRKNIADVFWAWATLVSRVKDKSKLDGEEYE